MKTSKLKKVFVSFMSLALFASGLIIPGAAAVSADSVAAAVETVAAAADSDVLPYQDTSLTFAERATDLVSRMTNAEKATQINTAAPAVPRLGVRAYDWWREAIHGVQGRDSVSYPVSLSMSLSWDRELLHDSASIIGTEARAYFTDQFRWLGQFTPTVNMQRDPRWGRNEEGYGEDPFLVGELGVEYVAGIQGNNDAGDVFSPAGEKYLKVMATPKHYAANNSEQNRYNGDSVMDKRDLLEYYTPQFRTIAERAEPASYMTAYNRVNSVPAFAHTYLNNTLLRKTWGFDGFIVSDCDGPANISSRHSWVPNVSYPGQGLKTSAVTVTEGIAFSLMGGTDLACNWKSNNTNNNFFQDTAWGGAYADNITAAINQGVRTDNGVIGWDDVDRALVRMFTKRLATGEFDADAATANLQNGWHVGGDYGSYAVSTHVQTPENVASTLQASREGVVLLKNKDNILPLKTDKIKSIAVIGRFLDHVELGASNYAGTPRAADRVNFRQGITKVLQDRQFDTANGLKFYVPSTSLVTGSLFNLRDFSVNGVTIAAIAATQTSGCQKTDTQIGSITDQSYAIFDLPANTLANGLINSFGISVSTANIGTGTTAQTLPVVELRLGSPGGELLAKATGARTANAATWDTTVVSDLSAVVHGSDQKLCLVFTTSRSVPNAFTAEQLEEIKNADVAIYYAGSTVTGNIGLTVSGENSDRANMNLPGSQVAEIRQLINAGAKIVLPIQAVGTMNISDFEDEVEAVLFTSYNGQKQGQALAEILVGDVNPSGRLSFTWYKHESQLPNILDYDMRPSAGKLGRTYQYFTGDVLYPFGFGLSYSSYSYSNMGLSKNTVSAAEKFTVSVDVENTTGVAGAEVVQVYVAAPGAGNGEVPFKQLKGFERVELGANQKKTVQIELNSDDFWFIDPVTEKRVVREGAYTVQIGRASDDIKGSLPLTISGTVKPWLKTVTLTGDKIIVNGDQSAQTELSIALSDDTLITAPTPEQAAVAYSSNRPSVAAVDQNGRITAGAGEGTAVITAAVTYEGKTLSASYVVASEGDPSLGEPQPSSLDFSPGNPYLPLWEHIPDGEPRVFEDPENPGKYRAYIYGSHDLRFSSYCGPDIRAWSAPVEDLSDWRDEGPIFTYFINNQWDVMYAPDIVEVKRFAPDVIARGRTAADQRTIKEYYLYPNDQGGGRAAQVAKGPTPVGPFAAVNMNAAGTGTLPGSMLGFDPGVFVEYVDDPADPDYNVGFRAYGYWGFQRSYAAELDQATMYSQRAGGRYFDYFMPSSSSYGNLRDPAGTEYPALFADEKPTDFNFFEASSIRKVGNKYVMIFSGYSGPDYGTGSTNSTLRYCYGDTPLGPWRSGGVLVDSRGIVPNQDGTALQGRTWGHNTHGSIEQINGQWYAFYHRPPRGFGYMRQPMVAPVKIDWDAKSVAEGGKVTIRAYDPYAADKTWTAKDSNGNEYTGAEVTSEGFQIYGLDPYQYYSAGYASYMSNGNSIQDSWDIWDNNMPITNAQNNNIIGYKYFGFGGLSAATATSLGLRPYEGTKPGNATTFDLWLTPRTAGAFTVNVWMDGPWANDTWKGTKIGEISVPAGSAQETAKFSVDVSQFVDSLDGKHAIFLVVSGGSGNLCDIIGLGFSSAQKETARAIAPTVRISVNGEAVTLPTAPVRSTNANGITGYGLYEATHILATNTSEPATVTASASDRRVKVDITQPDAPSGTAVVRFNYEGVAKTYTINIISDYVPPSAEAGSAWYGSPTGMDDAAWALAKPLKVQKDSEGSVFARGDAYVLWDESNLYVRVDVTDPTIDGGNSSDWLKDSVEVFLSEDAVKGSYTAAQGNQYRVTYAGSFSAKSTGTAAYTAMNADPQRRTARLIDGGYSVYMAIPLAQPASEGKKVTFDVQINNAANGNRVGVSTWSDPFGDGYNTAAYWGDLTLTKAGRVGILKTSKIPTIDSEAIWAQTQPLSVSKIAQNDAATLATGVAKALWDDGSLYVRVDVTDPDVNAVNGTVHLRDSVEVYLSEVAARGAYSATQGNQFRLGSDGGFSGKTTNASSPAYQAMNADDGAWRRVVKTTATGYAVFMAIPLGLRDEYGKPAPGKNYTFDVQINDATAPTNTRTGQTTWNDPAANGYSSADGWGELVLMAQGIGAPVEYGLSADISDGIAAATYVSDSPAVKTVNLIIAVYDQKGAMAGYASKQAEVELDGSASLTMDVSKYAASGHTCKAFAWDGNFVPLAEAAELEL